MSQITTGIRGLLRHPALYNLLQFSLGSKKGCRDYVENYIRPSSGDKILDIGCGTAEILEFLPLSVDYVGFDLDPTYIQHAKMKYGKRGKFICSDVNDRLADLPQFDLILANGVLHHLKDEEVRKLFRMAASCLGKQGRIMTIDGCYLAKQAWLARFLISKDRGQNVRSPEGYQALALPFFEKIETHVKHDLLRVPYTHFIMECSQALIE